MLRKKFILVVDDDAGMLRALDKVLRHAGCAVTPAQSGDEAMERLAERRGGYDLVITDLRMPLINGKTILDTVRAVFPRLPVMIITAYAGPDTKAYFLHHGAAGFLEKPVDSPKLLAEVGRILVPAGGQGIQPATNQ